MRFRIEVPAQASSDEIRARLSNERWPTWWPGARPGPAGRVDLELGGPRPVRVGLQVVPRATGAEIALVEGELSMCTAVVEVGATVVADVELAFPTAIPLALHHDLRAWLTDRVAAVAAGGVSTRSADG